MRIITLPILTLFSFFLQLSAYGQIMPNIIANSGSSFMNSFIQLDWTLGELMVDQRENGNLLIDEGFHQLFVEDISTVVSGIKPDTKVVILPNPTTHWLKINIDDLRPHEYKMYNNLGELVESGTISGRQRIDVSSITTGRYFLKLVNSAGAKRVFSFIKI